MSSFNTKAEFNRKRRHLNETEIADMPMTDVADPTQKPTVYSIMGHERSVEQDSQRKSFGHNSSRRDD
jgi:hypothetical protein